MCIRIGMRMFINQYDAAAASSKSIYYNNKVANLAQASAIAVVFDNMQTARCTLARSPPGTTVGGW